ncbi:MAG TPA: M48 family metallopeptidase [Streptosporangiaceae bacterium]|jgi:Zn-dependent protease with chaperone function|nr:M48 family metallopeptidase [Streptosporangiaceae bacterium]
MTSVPDRARVRLPGISSRAYEHPADRSALVALRKLTGFDVLLRRLAGLFSDRSLRLLFLASSVRASNEQFPDLYQLLLDGSAILDLPEVPELYISQDPLPNAMTLGSDKPFIVITTGLLDLLDAEEHRYVIGHELGHVLSGHAVYRTMLYHLTQLATRLAWFAIGYIGLRVIIAGLEEWYRKSELSCDRAGVLASQDPAAGRRALMKIAGGSRMSELSPDEFLKQAREYDAVPDVREGLLKLLQMQGTTHPFAVVRFAELDRWVADGEYENILAGNYLRRDDDGNAKVGDEFLAAARSYQESWNRSEDPFIGLVKGVAETAAGAGERLFEGIFGRRGGGGTGGSGGGSSDN